MGTYQRKPRIVFVEQFYYPEGWGGAELPKDLTTHLACSGYDVCVICGSDQYAPVEGDASPDPRDCGVRIIRVPRLFPGSIHRLKALRQLWFCLALLPLLVLSGRPDLLVSQTNPPLAVLLIAAVARLMRRPYLLIAMDIYPEILVAHGAAREDSLLYRNLSALFNRAYRAATAVVALGPVMRDRLLAKGVATRRIREISNWATGPIGVVRGSDNPLRREWGLQDEFVILYSGNLGIGHEFDTLILALARASEKNSTIRLVIVGQGSRLREVQRLVADHGLERVVRLSGFVPAARLPETMGLADLSVVTLRSGFEGLIVPSKLLGYMARGIPVLYVGPRSDVDQYLGHYGCGVSLRNGDIDGVCAAILNVSSDSARLLQMGQAGRAGYDKDLCRSAALAQYDDVIRECMVAAAGAGAAQ